MAIVVALTAAPADASAHDQPYSYVNLMVGPGGIEVTVTAHVVDLAHETAQAAPDSLLQPLVLNREGGRLAAILSRRLEIDADGRPIRTQWHVLGAAPQRSGVTFRFQTSWSRVPGSLTIRCALFPHDPQHVTYVNVYEGGALRHQDLLDRSRTSFVYFTGSARGRTAVFGQFLFAGIHHIFIGPDHILFVIALLLAGGGFARQLKIVTAFTVAHSVTLVLATLQIVNPPARLIEPAIAASIVFVGVHNLLTARSGRDVRALIAFGFGFVHGFGFASVLRDFGLPQQALGMALFSFNAGVEVGQACIVAAVAPILALVRARGGQAHRRILSMASVCVILAGTYWFFQRILAPV